MPYKTLSTIILWSLLSFDTLYAQGNREERSYTAPREISGWVYLGSSQNSRYDYDTKSVIILDSMRMIIRLKETPLLQSYYETRRTKMWEQRSIQGYSDSLRTHPEFCYDGYDRYGYSIYVIKIDFCEEKYIVLKSIDLDMNGIVLHDIIYETEEEKNISDGSSERMVVNLFSKDKTQNIGNN